jgi:hypothetical protein
MLISDDLTYADLFSLLVKAEEQLNRKINPTFYSKSEWARKQREANPFVTQVMQQPKIFLIGTEDELNEFR